jgi:hypothetical protein
MIFLTEPPPALTPIRNFELHSVAVLAQKFWGPGPRGVHPFPPFSSLLSPSLLFHSSLSRYSIPSHPSPLSSLSTPSPPSSPAIPSPFERGSGV